MEIRRKLFIDMNKWVRGGKGPDGNKAESYLLNDRGLMCCLGFDAFSLGSLEHNCFEMSYPSELTNAEAWGLENSQDFCYCGSSYGSLKKYQILAIINDAQGDDEVRIAWLKEGFKVWGGIEVEFGMGPK